MKNCPVCFSAKRTRKKRLPWMKLIPLARHYHCLRCESNYMYIELMDISIVLKRSPRKKGDKLI